jgi:hypothetical protein
VGNLVGNNIDERAVTGNQSRGRERQAAVLHAAVGERLGEDKETDVSDESGCKLCSTMRRLS